MSDPQKTFRDQLLQQQPITPALQQRYQQEVQAMFDKPLSGAQRIAWMFSVILCGILGIVFVAAALLAPAEFPLFARIGFLGGTLFTIVWVVLALRTLRRGSINLKTDSAVYYGLAWSFPLFMLVLFMMFAPNDLTGLRMIVCGIAYLIMGAAFLLRGVVERSELQTRERILELQYRLAELEEQLKVQQ